MYGKKYQGDKIDPIEDFKGSLANRSNLSICIPPPIKRISTDSKINEKGRVLSQEYRKLKRNSECQPIPVQPPTINKRKNRESIWGKLGKRISTIGISECLNDVDSNKNSNSNGSKNTKRGVSMDYVYQINETSDFNAYPKLSKQETFIDMNHQVSEYSEKRPISLESLDDQDDIVYTKNNQLFINFPDDSQTSLVSKLLDEYSKFNLENPSSNIAPLTPPQRNTHSSYNSTISGGISTSDDIFSNAPTSCYTGSSDSIDLVNTDNENNNHLLTTNYNKELPSIPIKNINQFDLRDYTNTLSAEVIDPSIPPEVPKHQFVEKESTPYYDCKDSFSFTSSKYSDISNDDNVMKFYSDSKKIIPQDTSIYTRSSTRKEYNGIKTVESKAKEQIRSASSQYLEKAGISPFMLNGYQENTQLRVIN